ncbi:MAG: hypothetical protein IJZ79_05350 [Bacilli bacterium]|nr:hypothetical protein [Bacilli bacterium]
MKKLIKSLILSLFTFLGILIYSKIIFKETTYNIFISLSFFLIWYYYYNYNPNYDKLTKYYSIILSIILSILLSVGSIVSSYIYELDAPIIFNIKNIIYSLISIIGLSMFLYRIIGYSLLKLKKITFIEKHNKMSIKIYLLVSLIIFCGSLVYFLRYYPAIMTPDSYYVIHYSNNFILSDFHTFGHTWFFGIFFHLGKLLFDSLNTAVAFSIIIQMICMSLIFSLVIKFLYDKGLKRNYCIFLILLYTLNPLYTHYNITLWRDVMFGGSFIIILVSLYEYLNNKKITINNTLLFIIGIIILLFFRNNGIYIYLFMIPFLIIFLKEKRKFISILTITILIVYFIIKGPIFEYFNVEKTRSVEAFSIPLQQIARVITSENEIDNDDKLFLEKLFDYDSVKEKYNPTISDPIKNITSNDILSNEKKQFFKTYLNLFIKYPNIYLEAYFLQTLGYWYPDNIYWATAGESESIFDSENVYSDPITSGIYNKIIDSSTSRRIPLSNLIWSIGLHFMVLLSSSLVLCYLGYKKILLSYVPLWGLWLSIVIATPVFSELRYAYGLFTCMPLLLFIPLITYSKNKVK